MSTRATIALENEKGSVRQIYCHFDGYLEGVGETLKKHYSTRESVEQLTNLGNLSSLGEDIKSSVFYEDEGARYFINYECYMNMPLKEAYNYVFRKDGKWYVEHNKKISLL